MVGGMMVGKEAEAGVHRHDMQSSFMDGALPGLDFLPTSCHSSLVHDIGCCVFH